MVYAKFYSAQPDASVIETDKALFSTKMEVLKKQGCEYIQKFTGTKISKYYSVVAVGYGSAFITRVNEVNQIYGMSPAIIKKEQENYYVTYILQRGASKALAESYASAISNILSCSTQFHSPLLGVETTFSDESIVLDQSISDSINRYFIDRDKSVGDSINDQIVQIANDIDASEVVAKFGRSTEQVDKHMNIIVGYGFPFSYVMNVLGSLDNAFKFFNEHFSVGFVLQERAIATYFVDGVISKDYGMYEYLGGYAVDSQKGVVRVTDFLIRVHYKLIKDDETVYAISLIGKDGKKTKVIHWSNSASEASLVETVQSYGNYHFLNPKKEYLIKIHSMISSTEVPNIYVIPHMGRAKFMGNDILIYGNGVFDISRKKYFPKIEGNDFYFMDGTDGFIVQDKNGNDVINTCQNIVPTVKSQDVYGYDDYINIFQNLWKDHTGDILIMYAMAYLGYALFSEEDVTYSPLFVGHGVTGSGKTTFASFIKMLLGINGEPIAIGRGTTAFALKTTFGSINKLPIMGSEFRAGNSDADAKESMLRSLYDRKPMISGRSDQTIVSYDLISTLFMEGEELPQDGAVRTRLVHKQLHRRYRQDSDIHSIIGQNKHKIDAFLNSYQFTADKSIYEDSMAEGREIFRGKNIEPRIVDNISLIYASCMAFDPTKKEYIIEILKKLLSEQQDDFDVNSTGQQFIKALGQYSSSRFSHIYTDEVKNTVIFGWDEVVAFIKRQGIPLTLQVESYRDHLVELGWEEGLFEVSVDSGWGERGEIAIDGFSIRIDKAPKCFLSNASVYKIYKKLQCK